MTEKQNQIIICRILSWSSLKMPVDTRLFVDQVISIHFSGPTIGVDYFITHLHPSASWQDGRWQVLSIYRGSLLVYVDWVSFAGPTGIAFESVNKSSFRLFWAYAFSTRITSFLFVVSLATLTSSTILFIPYWVWVSTKVLHIQDSESGPELLPVSEGSAPLVFCFHLSYMLIVVGGSPPSSIFAPRRIRDSSWWLITFSNRILWSSTLPLSVNWERKRWRLTTSLINI